MIFRRHSDYLTNPDTQIIFHKRMMLLWQVTAPLMLVIYLLSLFASLRVAILILGFINFATNMMSVYANWDTDYGALSAAQGTKAASVLKHDGHGL